VVTYRGTPDLLNAVVAGDVQIASEILPPVLPQIQAGRLRALAVVSRERVPQLPEVPTTIEAGFPDLVTTLWNGLFAPVGTPAPIVSTLHGEVTRILRDPDVLANLERQAVRATPSDSPAAFASYVAEDVARWTALTREFNIVLN